LRVLKETAARRNPLIGCRRLAHSSASKKRRCGLLLEARTAAREVATRLRQQPKYLSPDYKSVVGCYSSKGGLDNKNRRLLQVDKRLQQC
jgi:hypothetical protein